MTGFELKMIKKNTKPMLWKRLYVPGGITFTQLSFILDEMFRLPQDPHFGFEFYSCKAQISERDAYSFKRGKWEYDHFNADQTYIDDYLGTQPWFSYYRSIDNEETAFRVEIEERFLNADFPAPELIKTVTLKKNDETAYWESLNEILARRYYVCYEEDPAWLTHEEINRQLEGGRTFAGSLHPVSAPLEMGDASISRSLTMISAGLKKMAGVPEEPEDSEDPEEPEKAKKYPAIVPARIMEKKAWIQRCDYAVTKLYGACRVDEFCTLCKTAAYLDLQDSEIEGLFDEIPDEDLTCARLGNRYVRKALIEKGSYENLLKWHRGKRISYPTEKVIDELWTMGYPDSDPVYKMAAASLVQDVGADKKDCENYLRLIFDEFSYGGQISDIVPLLEKEGLKPQGKQAAQTLTALLVMLNNNTRMALHKGNSPADLDASAKKAAPFGRGAFGSSGAAAPQSVFAGSSSQISSAAPAGNVKNAPKIYPNDPCPCGSGKKYKKCCGRNK